MAHNHNDHYVHRLSALAALTNTLISFVGSLFVIIRAIPIINLELTDAKGMVSLL